MITPSFGLTATERVLPRLALDWTIGAAQSGVDVTRAGVATFVGSNGLIQSASADTQRIDYSTGTAGLLVEESRTNRALYSETFDALAWVPFNGTVETENVTAPDGSAQTKAIIEDVSNGIHGAYANIAFTNVAETFSCYVQSKNGRNIFFYIRDSHAAGTIYCGATVNLTTGVATNVTGTVKVEALGDYFRISCSAVVATGTKTIVLRLMQGTSASYQGDGDSGVYAWGAQLEAGAFPTSYIPTEATAVTRNADVATMTGTNFSDWFNATEGSVFVIASSFAQGADNAIFCIADNLTNQTNQIDIRFASSGTVSRSRVRSNNATTLGDLALSATPFAANTICFGFKADDAAAANGTTIVTDTSGAMPVTTMTRLILGDRGVAGGIDMLNGRISKLFYYPQKLTNAEILAFSK